MSYGEKEIKAQRKLKHGDHKPWKKGDHPHYNPKTKNGKKTCNICLFHSKHMLYVCPKCGNCQNCGGANVIGNVNQSCMFCGNGHTVPPFVPPAFNTGHGFDQPHRISRENSVRKAHKKKQSSASISVSNIQT